MFISVSLLQKKDIKELRNDEQYWIISDVVESGKSLEEVPNRTKKGSNEWLSGSWPLRQFDETISTNKRKAEWIRFCDQFERILACKTPVDAETRVAGLKIFAGSYLLSIIEMQQRSLTPKTQDVYKDTSMALNEYFNDLCDASKERLKFREMKMKSKEPFAD